MMVPRDLWEKKLLHEEESKLWFLSPGGLLLLFVYPKDLQDSYHIEIYLDMILYKTQYTRIRSL